MTIRVKLNPIRSPPYRESRARASPGTIAERLLQSLADAHFRGQLSADEFHQMLEAMAGDPKNCQTCLPRLFRGGKLNEGTV